MLNPGARAARGGYLGNRAASPLWSGESSHQEHVMVSQTRQPTQPAKASHDSKGKPQDKSKVDKGGGAEDESTDSDADDTKGGKDSEKRGGTKDPKAKR